jgi:hypothetical protein
MWGVPLSGARCGRGPALALAAALTLTPLAAGCDILGNRDSPSSSASPSSSGPPGSTSSSGSPHVPNVVGKRLDTAHEDARTAGFTHVTYHDAAGRARHVILQRDWTVCSQAPAAGQVAASDVTFSLAVVKTDEQCPVHDQNGPSLRAAVGQPLPDFIGQGLNVVADAFPKGTFVHWKDLSPKQRTILVPSNWKACTQSPAAGVRYTGQRIDVGAVKHGESCP